MKANLHRAGALLAFSLITVFLASTLISELFLSHDAVAGVKQGIVYALIGLVLALMLTAGSGFSIARDSTHTLVSSKRQRMPFIALNGLLILVPLALYLNAKAASGQFDVWFYSAQVLELIAGSANLALIGLNIRDGLRLRHA